ncbi:class I SAM-dependent methyltransferase [Nocardia colli]|uniref:class I SAM-dependent methyltransferase n=1 Tax=Nocardia colli TaxID=2545717 RepID=UPI0035DF2FFB
MDQDQFSALGNDYEDTAATPFRAYVEIPSMLAAIGEVKGAAVLDAGCGTGVYARLLARSGATRVLGIDASDGMLSVAKELEQQLPLGVEYRTGDISVAQGLDMDLVVAVYLLPYARTGADLLSMCRGLAAALRPGGRLVTAVLNPDYAAEPGWYAQYGFALTTAGERDEDDPVVLSVDQDGMSFEVSAYYHGRQTMESALREAGFREIIWAGPHAAPAGIDRHGQEFWDNYLRCPHALIVRARLDSAAAA